MNRCKLFSRARLLLAILTLPALPHLLAAQDTTRVRPKTPNTSSAISQQQQRLTPEQQRILQRLRESGMTKEQVRQRLRQAGYDPNLADRYFDELNAPVDTATGNRVATGYTRPIPPPNSSLQEALRRIGVLERGDTVLPQNIRPDTLRDRVATRRTTADSLQIFGRDLFAASTQFDATMTDGPVDPDYKLGPGDQLTLIVTGDVELAYDLTVTREGYIVIPDVGQVVVNGLTLAEAKRRLNERLARVYSGVQVGTTQADISVGRVRNKLIYVIGDAEVPNAYTVSGSATVFNALYRAGGPSRSGSFRNIQVRRGNKTVHTVDLYDYLLRGDKSGDVRLEQGDVVFIPVVGKTVLVTGGVRRPGIYELKDNEGLADVLTFAGGTRADAAIERIQIDRILPPEQRTPGRDRVLVDVALADLARAQKIAMQDNDRVRISRVSSMRRNRVVVNGDVQRPGEYEYDSGMSALDLIKKAQGLLPSAYTQSAHVVRLNLADSSTSIVRVVLDDPASADYAGKIRLQDLDELSIFGRVTLANPKRIEIFGYVKNEGTYNFSEGMRLEDLVLMAGGFTEGAAEGMAEVARRAHAGGIRDTIATVYRVPLSMRLSENTKGAGDAPPFELKDGDQVFIRRAPDYQPLSTVELTGEVTYPGVYTVRERTEHVTEVIARAGGLTPEAYASGFRLFRDGKPVGVDFTKALKHPGSADDIVLVPGDRMEIPRFDPTVLVTGAVEFESRVRFEPGLSVQDYIARAGGATDTGNTKKASVRYANGELRTPRSFLGARRYPKVQPGSTITVPERPAGAAFDWDRVVGRTISTLSALATIVLTINAIK